MTVAVEPKVDTTWWGGPVGEIDADIFDALEQSANAHGGIGGHSDFRYDATVPGGCPHCIAGHAIAADVGVDGEAILPAFQYSKGNGLLSRAINDDAVERINSRKATYTGSRDDKCARVTWAEYIAERGIVRKAVA